MIKRNLWKLVFSLLIAAWAVSELVPFTDTPFPEYIRTHATAQPGEFAKLVNEAEARMKAGTTKTIFTGLREIGKERKIDISQYFPDIKLEASLRNVDKRNGILLNELLRRSKARLQKGLDIAGGISVTLQVDDKVASTFTDSVRAEKITQAVGIMDKRINALGVAEPVIRPVGTTRIEVQLPALNTKDDPEIIDNIKKPAQLLFRLVHPTLSPLTTPPDQVPAGYEVLSLDDDSGNGTRTEELFVKRIPEMGGDAISTAFARRNQFGANEVILNLTSEGRKQFAEVTRKVAETGRQTGRDARLAIVLDGVLYSAPRVEKEIDSDSAQITGSFTDREAINLSNVLNNPLDLPLQVVEQSEVGPSLATDAVERGLRSAIIGTALVAAFMITFYTTGGIVSVITLAVNIVIILGVMASIGATMTLPGLAGIVLTIGMAVDANILIFERMREELAAQKSLATANQSGYRKALTTILDAHIVQLIICGVMIWLGTGPIKGFGVTLAIGVLSTLFSVLITAHLVMEMLIDGGIMKKLWMGHILKRINVDFIKYGKPALIGSLALVAIGIGVIAYKGKAIYGIDFSGGDLISVQYSQQAPDTERIRQVAVEAGVTGISITRANPVGGNKETINVETPVGKADTVFAAMKQAYPNSGLEIIGQSHIGAAVGKEIQWNAVLAVGVSMMAILIYIAFRFEFGFGVGAMASTLHDIFMTIGIFVITDHQFSAPMVAAILCIAGYSINETVVVFDRIREELRLDPNGKLRDVVNSAINKVFARTIMTASTTFLAALALYVFGGGVLRDISFTFLVGIVTSTFSAIFVAAQIFYFWHRGDRKHVEAHADVAPKYEWQGGSKASE